MSLHKSCLFASAIFIFSAASSPAKADIIKVYPATNVQGQTKYKLPTILVKGKSRGRYGSVETRELLAWLVIRGEAPERAVQHLHASLRIAGTNITLDKPGSPKIARYGFVYTAPDSFGGTYQLSPVELCNKEAPAGAQKIYQERRQHKIGKCISGRSQFNVGYEKKRADLGRTETALDLQIPNESCREMPANRSFRNNILNDIDDQHATARYGSKGNGAAR